MPISSQALPSIPHDDSETVLIVQQEKLLRSAVSDYICRIVDGRELHQRVITEPRPQPDVNHTTVGAATPVRTLRHLRPLPRRQSF